MIGALPGISQTPDNSDDRPSQYDVVPYPSHAYPETHPDRLKVMAVLFGLDPPPVETSRILEIGCGDGSNIIPIAFSLPQAHCVGIDFACKPIEASQSLVRRTGIENVKCEVMDVRDITKAFGTFDYVLAHGFFSWVPAPVQEKVLTICRDNLAPTGVALISYNTYPAGHIREASRELMLFHLQQNRDTNTLVSCGMDFLQDLQQMINGNDLWKALIRAEVERLTKRHTNTVFHDEFSPIYSPVYFKDFVSAAERLGLQFLSEALLEDMINPHITPEVERRLNELANGDLITYYQYLDFVLFRGFRRTLLCHRDIQLKRDALHQGLQRLWIASPLVRSPGALDGGCEFRNQRGTGTYTTKSPIMLSVLDHLEAIWPNAERFDLLLKQISAPLSPELKRQAIDNLAPNLLMLAAGALIDIRSYPIPLPDRVPGHPTATPLERVQAQEGTMITTLLHTQVRITDDHVRFLLLLLDGSRDREALIEAFVSHYPNITRQVSERQIDSVLHSFYKLGILTASTSQ